jgi:hypothetical protein
MILIKMGKSFSKDKFKMIYDREAVIDGDINHLQKLLHQSDEKESLKQLFELLDFEGRNPLHLVN